MKRGRVFLAFIVLFVLFFPLIKADIISVNSGGANEIAIGPDAYLEGFYACFPKTCSQLGYDCDSWSDQCGGTLNCGTCASGFTCSSGICTAVTPTPTPTPTVTTTGGGGGGGGGSGVILKKELTGIRVIPEDFIFSVDSASVSFAKISVLSLADSELDISISLTNSLGGIVSFEETSFTLGAGDTKTLDFKINSPIDGDVHTGKIILQSKGEVLEIPFILNVRKGLRLFDIAVDVAEENRIINPGEKLKGQITLIQAGVKENVDVQINYIIKDFENNVYSEETETIMIFDQKTYENEFNTANLAVGDYILGVEVIYSGGIATASSPFQIIEEGVTKTAQLVYIIILSALLIGIATLILLLRYYRKKIRSSLRGLKNKK